MKETESDAEIEASLESFSDRVSSWAFLLTLITGAALALFAFFVKSGDLGWLFVLLLVSFGGSAVIWLGSYAVLGGVREKMAAIKATDHSAMDRERMSLEIEKLRLEVRKLRSEAKKKRRPFKPPS